jgi:hypothetical protein
VHILALVVHVLHQALGGSVSCSFEPQPARYMAVCRLSKCTDVCAWLYRDLSSATDILWCTEQIDAVAQASATAADCYACQDVTLM